MSMDLKPHRSMISKLKEGHPSLYRDYVTRRNALIAVFGTNGFSPAMPNPRDGERHEKKVVELAAVCRHIAESRRLRNDNWAGSDSLLREIKAAGYAHLPPGSRSPTTSSDGANKNGAANENQDDSLADDGRQSKPDGLDRSATFQKLALGGLVDILEDYLSKTNTLPSMISKGDRNVNQSGLAELLLRKIQGATLRGKQINGNSLSSLQKAITNARQQFRQFQEEAENRKQKPKPQPQRNDPGPVQSPDVGAQREQGSEAPMLGAPQRMAE